MSRNSFQPNYFFIAMLLVCLAFAQLPIMSLQASGGTVKVTLPEFPVNVDGTEIDSTILRYPLIKYKDITYVPMTHDVGKGTGLRIEWSDEKGLDIHSDRNAKTELLMEAGARFSQDQTYNAHFVRFPVTLNGQAIDNDSDIYPLLEFEDITYFPLTWRFAVEMFGWRMTWDETKGFSIQTSPRSSLSQIVYDDEQYLYAIYNSGGDPERTSPLIRIHKDLQGMPEYMGIEQSAAIWRFRQEQHSGTMTPPPQTERKDNIVSLNGVELLSLQPFYEKKKNYYEAHPESRNSGEVWWRERVVPMKKDAFIVSMSIVYLDHIPEPYTPHDDNIFLVQGSTVNKLEAMDEWIYDAATASNGTWIWSMAPDIVGVRNNEGHGKVMWVGDDRQTRLWNNVLNAQCLQALGTDHDSLIVQAYTLSGDKMDGIAEGFYRLHADGTYEKLSDSIAKLAYVDRSGTLYVFSDNSITNLISSESLSW